MKPYPALCKDCKHSKPDKNSAWNLRCHNPQVNAHDPWTLGGISGSGTDCAGERMRWWPAVCGMRGAQWENLK